MKQKRSPFLEGLILGLVLGLGWVFLSSEHQPLKNTSQSSKLKPHETQTLKTLSQQKGLTATDSELSQLNQEITQELRKIELRRQFQTQKKLLVEEPKTVLSTDSYESRPLFHDVESGINLGEHYPTDSEPVPEQTSLEDEIQTHLDRKRYKNEYEMRKRKAFVKAFIEKAHSHGYEIKVNKYFEIISVVKIPNQQRQINSLKEESP